MTRARLPVLVALALMAGGCARLSVERSTTTRQERTDLDRARAAGAVSDAEYDAIRAGLSRGGPTSQRRL